MGVKIKEAFPKNDVVIGFGHIKSRQRCPTTKKPEWVLPGGKRICNQDVAVECAKTIDKLIRYNCEHRGKELI